MIVVVMVMKYSNVVVVMVMVMVMMVVVMVVVVVVMVVVVMVKHSLSLSPLPYKSFSALEWLPPSLLPDWLGDCLLGKHSSSLLHSLQHPPAASTPVLPSQGWLHAPWSLEINK